MEQIYYLGVSAYGWWYWSRGGPQATGRVEVIYGPRLSMALWLGGTALCSVAVGAGMSRIHLWLPRVFPEAASFPFLDALTTVMSLTAMWLMARRRIESWVYWIVVDLIGIGLYWVKDVRFIALLYVVLLALAVRGLMAWHAAARPNADPATPGMPVAVED